VTVDRAEVLRGMAALFERSSPRNLPARGSPTAPPTLSSRTVVALVEDDPLLREEGALHLRVYGFVVHAVNCASALDDLIMREKIDLLVIDLNLPGEDGLSLSKRLRQTLAQAGIVILTARVALHDRLMGYQRGGADVYLGKPVPPEELVALIQAKKSSLDSADLCDLLAEDELDNTISKHALEESVARLRRKFKRVQSETAEPAIKSVWGNSSLVIFRCSQFSVNHHRRRPHPRHHQHRHHLHREQHWCRQLCQKTRQKA